MGSSRIKQMGQPQTRRMAFGETFRRGISIVHRCYYHQLHDDNFLPVAPNVLTTRATRAVSSVSLPRLDLGSLNRRHWSRRTQHKGTLEGRPR